MSEDTVLKDEEGNQLELDIIDKYGIYTIWSNVGMEMGKLIEEIWSDIFKNED